MGKKQQKGALSAQRLRGGKKPNVGQALPVDEDSTPTPGKGNVTPTPAGDGPINPNY